MSKGNNLTGGFTLPGESGYEKLTLELAEKWGADVIRDSDGTELSEEILQAGYGIYSTICIIRDHNEWASKNLDKLQSCLLMTDPRTAFPDKPLAIRLMEDFFEEQFRVNDSACAMRYWQVFDRTTGDELPRDKWHYDESSAEVVIDVPTAYHSYSVNFFAWRIWEEISMYNHTTNHWTSEHLMQIDPIYPETQAYLLQWMDKWCREHPATTVVRFTSMFYNFVWIWGASERNRNRFTDWASYDFTVSPRMLDLFSEKYGYALTSEDFINNGKLHVTHMPPTDKQRDYMSFVNDFVITFGKKLIDIVHSYGKKAYVFYDDSWVGVEPTSPRFTEFGFDGLIKCVFSGYEVRLNASVPVDTHEIRLHPYLFPVGLGGLPTFAPGGNPTLDAMKYWSHVRRGLLRVKIDRIGLGGYLHLLEGYPDFVGYIAGIADEFRKIRALHEAGSPKTLPVKAAVLHSWGKLRSWTLSGHFHETFMHDLIHVNEALAGFPIDVEFLDFEEIKDRDLNDINIIINAGSRGSAWSGGDAWKDPALIGKLSGWVAGGGTFLGINSPSAICDDNSNTVFALSNILGVDLDIPALVCHGRLSYEVEQASSLIPEGAAIPEHSVVHLTDENARVLACGENSPAFVINDFGKGHGIYLAGFEENPVNDRLLLNILLYASGIDISQAELVSDNPYVEASYFPSSDTIVVVNSTDTTQRAAVTAGGTTWTFDDIPPYETLIQHKNG